MRLKSVVCTVVGLSMALTACGGSNLGQGGDKPAEPEQSTSSSATPEADKHVAPAAVVVPLIPDHMPEPLKKPRENEFYGELQGTKGTLQCPPSDKRCEAVVSGAIAEFGTEMFEDGGEYANFEVWEYRTPISAQGGFDAWKEKLDGEAKGFLALPEGRFGEQKSATTSVAGNKMGDRMLLVRQGKYVGVVTTYSRADIKDDGKPGPTALVELGKLLVQRMDQAEREQAPTASARHINLT
ncbi:hypothetical protein [Streptomyces cavernicola]|uniref:DUF3558 domain-containing protein n=1 Tax=Streptomyces cavernicola TaxID=3043613 RepID=A0ABT6SEL4_9ACTN|nr:hypothetical protein [Streptomyces sp. B-S-A6]MDI3406632.1 hypothetical protein [Streptomyces sp. B-S-A6]